MNIIDGKAIAQQERLKLQSTIQALREAGITPGLSVVLVGENPASLLYVRNKEKAAGELGIHSTVYRMPAETEQAVLMERIAALNADEQVHGILVQLPLPDGLDTNAVLETILPEKDIDGLHSSNAGKLLAGEACVVPCTPRGILKLIKSTGVAISGKHAVVVGRSRIVGKAVSVLLLQENATVTMCHSYTQDLAAHTRMADILIVATGCAGLIKDDMVKRGAVVIDVGNSYIGGKLCGDVDFETVKEKAGYITPVPGGVGPMTITMLMRNTVEAAARSLQKDT